MRDSHCEILKEAACNAKFAQALAAYMLLSEEDRKEILKFAEGLIKNRQIND
jgi:hypothetical protein